MTAEVKLGYKLTEVGMIPEDWEIKALREISPSQSVGLVINPSSYFDEAGTVPMLVGSTVGENTIAWRRANRISEESNLKIAASKLRAGDLVTVRVGEPGTTAVVPPELDGCNCASMMIVRGHSTFNSIWLCYAMNSSLGRRQVEGVQYGTAQKQFNISDAVNFIFPVPPRPDQDAIASALADMDSLIGGLDQLIAKKRDIKQATMQQLLTGKKRLPGFSGVWREAALSDIVDRLEAGVSVRSVNGAANADVPRVLKTSAIHDGKFFVDECKNIEPMDIWRAHGSLDGNTILISRMNTPGLVGEVGYVGDDHPSIFLPDRIWMTRLRKDSEICVRWLAYLLSSNPYKKRIKGEATGTSGSMKNIAKKSLLSLSILLPNKAEQAAIATVISDIDTELDTLESRRDKAKKLKQGMMQELLTGRIRLV